MCECVYYCNVIMLSHLQLDVIKGSLKDKAGQYRKMPTDLLNVDVYTVDEYQVMRKQMACLPYNVHTLFRYHTVYTHVYL